MLLIFAICILLPTILSTYSPFLNSDLSFSSCQCENNFSLAFFSKESTYQFIQNFLQSKFPTVSATFFFKSGWFMENPALFQSRLDGLKKAGHTIGISIEMKVFQAIQENNINLFKMYLNEELHNFVEFTGIYPEYLSVASLSNSPYLSDKRAIFDFARLLKSEFKMKLVVVPEGADIYINNGKKEITLLSNIIGRYRQGTFYRVDFDSSEENTNYLEYTLNGILSEKMAKIVPMQNCITNESYIAWLSEFRSELNRKKENEQKVNEKEKEKVRNKKVEENKEKEQNSKYIDSLENEIVALQGIKRFKYIKEFDTSGTKNTKSIFPLGMSICVILLCLLFN